MVLIVYCKNDIFLVLKRAQCGETTIAQVYNYVYLLMILLSVSLSFSSFYTVMVQ